MESKLLLKVTLLAIVAHFATSEDLVCNLMCPAIFAPVCGTDGKTYSNECFLNVERACNKVEVSVAYKGKCNSVEARDTLRIKCLPQMRSGVCTREYMPICGSDGTTYGNLCTFCYAMYLLQDQGKELTASHVGECRDTRSINTDETDCPPSSRHGICTLEWNPVCGSNGKTYGNRCAFCAAMYKLKDEGKDISIVHPGQCRSTRDIKTDENGCPVSSRRGICTLEWNPVCASDGNTYATKCAMCADMYKCEDEGRNNCKLTVVKTGMC